MIEEKRNGSVWIQVIVEGSERKSGELVGPSVLLFFVFVVLPASSNNYPYTLLSLLESQSSRDPQHCGGKFSRAEYHNSGTRETGLALLNLTLGSRYLLYNLTSQGQTEKSLDSFAISQNFGLLKKIRTKES